MSDVHRHKGPPEPINLGNMPVASLRALFAALEVVIAEIDEYGPELSTQRFLDQVDEYLENPETNLPQLLIEEELALRKAATALRSGVVRARQLLDECEQDMRKTDGE